MKDLGDASFPRIGITIINEESDPMGLYDDDQLHTVTLQCDIFAKDDQVHSLTVTDESAGSVASTVNSNRLVLNYPPGSLTNIKHDGSSYATTTIVDTDADFSTPATMGSGTVEVSFSTGNLNINSADVTSHDGESITSTYVVKLNGKKACQHLAREIAKKVKNNWRTADTFGNMFSPLLISNTPIPVDEELSLYRQTIEFQFKKFNIGEGL